jgi:general secretion pathway protein D
MSYTKSILVVALSLLLVSCANTPEVKQDSNASEEAVKAVEKPYTGPASLPDYTDQVEEEDLGQNDLRPVIKHGTGRFVKPPGSSAGRGAPEQGEITLNFEAVDLREVIKVVFEEILNENYLIDPAVQGVVTINTTLPVSKNDVLPILESILEINQATMVYEDSVYKIIPTANVKKMVTAPSVGDLRRAGQGIQVIPLRYVAAKEMQKILNSISDNADNIKVDEVRNILILNGSGRMINNYIDTIKMFDVDWLSGMSFGMFPLQHTDAKTIVDDLLAIIGDDKNGPLAGLVRLIPIERLNAVMVVSHQNYYITEIKKLIRQFDLGIDKAPGRRLYVYRLKHGKAENIADILQRIFGQQVTGGEEGTSLGSTESRKLSNIRSPGMSGVPLSSRETKTIDKLEERRPSVEPVRSSSATTSASAFPDSRSGAESSYPVTIIADSDNNAILVLASSQDYRKIQSTIQRLDVAPRQVLIEATIAEVQLTDNLSYGVRWFLEGGLGNGYTFDAGFGAPLPSAIGGEGFTLGIFNSAQELRLFFDVLETETSVNFLSAPQIMVVDNQTANFRVGDQVPITTRSSQSTTDANAPIVSEVQYRDTGTLLQVTPRINAGGMVTLEISQEVSRPGTEPAVGGGGNVPIAQRTIDSTVIVHSGQTIVLGGLIREESRLSKGGIPVLKDIPVMGNLFSSTTDETGRTELIITLTPKVVTNPNEAYEISQELREKLKEAALIDDVYRKQPAEPLIKTDQ